MLGKMLIHGLVAAALVGSAAAVFAQAKDNGYLSPTAAPSSPNQATAASATPLAHVTADNGYIRPTQADLRKSKHDREHRHERKSGRRDLDRDDD